MVLRHRPKTRERKTGSQLEVTMEPQEHVLWVMKQLPGDDVARILRDNDGYQVLRGRGSSGCDVPRMG